MNPLLIGAGLVSFAGVVMPYDGMQPFWKYWIYWLDPFHYLIGGLLGTVIWDVQVNCLPEEMTSFDPVGSQTCGEYMSDFFGSSSGYVKDPEATSGCLYCPYTTGADYAKTFNIKQEYYAWRDVSDCFVYIQYEMSWLTEYRPVLRHCSACPPMPSFSS